MKLARDQKGTDMTELNFEFEKAKLEVEKYIESKRPPIEVRNEVDLQCRAEGNNIFIYEIRPLWNNPDKKHDVPVAKITYVKSRKIWKIFAQRSDMKWHIHPINPEESLIKEVIRVIDSDEICCFWG